MADKYNQAHPNTEQEHLILIKELNYINWCDDAKGTSNVRHLHTLWSRFMKCISRSKFLAQTFFGLLRKTLILVLDSKWCKLDYTTKQTVLQLIGHCVRLLEPLMKNCSVFHINLTYIESSPWANILFPWESLLSGYLDANDPKVFRYFESEPQEIVIARIEYLLTRGWDDKALCLANYMFRYQTKLVMKFRKERTDSHFCYLFTKRQKINSLNWLILLLHKSPLPQIVHLFQENELCCEEKFLLLASLLGKKKLVDLNLTLIHLFVIQELKDPKPCCTKELFRAWAKSCRDQNFSQTKIAGEIKKMLVAFAPTSAHFYLFIDALWEQFGSRLLHVYSDLFVRAITTDMNHLDVAKSNKNTQDIEDIETRLACMFEKMSFLFNDKHDAVARECLLSSFALKPTEQCLYALQSLTQSILSDSSQSDLNHNNYSYMNSATSTGSSSHRSENGTVFHPLLSKGVENISYTVLTDLVIVLEAVRSPRLRFKYSEWQNAVTELNDYLREKCKGDTGNSSVTECYDSKTEGALVESEEYNVENFHEISEHEMTPEKEDVLETGLDLSLKSFQVTDNQVVISQNETIQTSYYENRLKNIVRNTTTSFHTSENMVLCNASKNVVVQSTVKSPFKPQNETKVIHYYSEKQLSCPQEELSSKDVSSGYSAIVSDNSCKQGGFSVQKRSETIPAHRKVKELFQNSPYVEGVSSNSNLQSMERDLQPQEVSRGEIIAYAAKENVENHNNNSYGNVMPSIDRNVTKVAPSQPTSVPFSAPNQVRSQELQSVMSLEGLANPQHLLKNATKTKSTPHDGTLMEQTSSKLAGSNPVAVTNVKIKLAGTANIKFSSEPSRKFKHEVKEGHGVRNTSVIQNPAVSNSEMNIDRPQSTSVKIGNMKYDAKHFNASHYKDGAGLPCYLLKTSFSFGPKNVPVIRTPSCFFVQDKPQNKMVDGYLYQFSDNFTVSLNPKPFNNLGAPYNGQVSIPCSSTANKHSETTEVANSTEVSCHSRKSVLHMKGDSAPANEMPPSRQSLLSTLLTREAVAPQKKHSYSCGENSNTIQSVRNINVMHAKHNQPIVSSAPSVPATQEVMKSCYADVHTYTNSFPPAKKVECQEQTFISRETVSSTVQSEFNATLSTNNHPHYKPSDISKSEASRHHEVVCKTLSSSISRKKQLNPDCHKSSKSVQLQASVFKKYAKRPKTSAIANNITGQLPVQIDCSLSIQSSHDNQQMSSSSKKSTCCSPQENAPCQECASPSVDQVSKISPTFLEPQKQAKKCGNIESPPRPEIQGCIQESVNRRPIKEKLFECKKCNKKLGTLWTLKMHFLNVHGIDLRNKGKTKVHLTQNNKERLDSRKCSPQQDQSIITNDAPKSLIEDQSLNQKVLQEYTDIFNAAKLKSQRVAKSLPKASPDHKTRYTLQENSLIQLKSPHSMETNFHNSEIEQPSSSIIQSNNQQSKSLENMYYSQGENVFSQQNSVVPEVYHPQSNDLQNNSQPEMNVGDDNMFQPQDNFLSNVNKHEQQTSLTAWQAANSAIQYLNDPNFVDEDPNLFGDVPLPPQHEQNATGNQYQYPLNDNLPFIDMYLQNSEDVQQSTDIYTTQHPEPVNHASVIKSPISEVIRPAQQSYPCSLCGKDFYNNDLLKTHIFEAHQKPPPSYPLDNRPMNLQASLPPKQSEYDKEMEECTDPSDDYSTIQFMLDDPNFPYDFNNIDIPLPKCEPDGVEDNSFLPDMKETSANNSILSDLLNANEKLPDTTSMHSFNNSNHNENQYVDTEHNLQLLASVTPLKDCFTLMNQNQPNVPTYSPKPSLVKRISNIVPNSSKPVTIAQLPLTLHPKDSEPFQRSVVKVYGAKSGIASFNITKTNLPQVSKKFPSMQHETWAQRLVKSEKCKVNVPVVNETGEFVMQHPSALPKPKRKQTVPVECPVCKKMLSSSASKNRHIKKVHNEDSKEGSKKVLKEVADESTVQKVIQKIMEAQKSIDSEKSAGIYHARKRGGSSGSKVSFTSSINQTPSNNSCSNESLLTLSPQSSSNCNESQSSFLKNHRLELSSSPSLLSPAVLSNDSSVIKLSENDICTPQLTPSSYAQSNTKSVNKVTSSSQTVPSLMTAPLKDQLSEQPSSTFQNIRNILSPVSPSNSPPVWKDTVTHSGRNSPAKKVSPGAWLKSTSAQLPLQNVNKEQVLQYNTNVKDLSELGLVFESAVCNESTNMHPLNTSSLSPSSEINCSSINTELQSASRIASINNLSCNNKSVLSCVLNSPDESSAHQVVPTTAPLMHNFGAPTVQNVHTTVNVSGTSLLGNLNPNLVSQYSSASPHITCGPTTCINTPKNPSKIVARNRHSVPPVTHFSSQVKVSTVNCNAINSELMCSVKSTMSSITTPKPSIVNMTEMASNGANVAESVKVSNTPRGIVDATHHAYNPQVCNIANRSRKTSCVIVRGVVAPTRHLKNAIINSHSNPSAGFHRVIDNRMGGALKPGPCIKVTTVQNGSVSTIIGNSNSYKRVVPISYHQKGTPHVKLIRIDANSIKMKSLPKIEKTNSGVGFSVVDSHGNKITPNTKDLLNLSKVVNRVNQFQSKSRLNTKPVSNVTNEATQTTPKKSVAKGDCKQMEIRKRGRPKKVQTVEKITVKRKNKHRESGSRVAIKEEPIESEMSVPKKRMRKKKELPPDMVGNESCPKLVLKKVRAKNSRKPRYVPYSNKKTKHNNHEISSDESNAIKQEIKTQVCTVSLKRLKMNTLFTPRMTRQSSTSSRSSEETRTKCRRKRKVSTLPKAKGRMNVTNDENICDSDNSVSLLANPLPKKRKSYNRARFLTKQLISKSKQTTSKATNSNLRSSLRKSKVREKLKRLSCKRLRRKCQRRKSGRDCDWSDESVPINSSSATSPICITLDSD